MKQILLLFTLLALLFSQFNLGVLYAQSITQLEAQKDASIEVLDKTEIAVDKVIEKLDEKINDEREERLREKEKEIGQYIEDVQEKIEKENSGKDVSELVSEAKKVVVLKVVSGITEYEDATENIPSDVANTPSEKRQAKKTIQESLETKSGDYSIMIQTKYSGIKLKKLFDKFDTNISLEFMYKDDNQNYFEVFIDEDSIFRQEMFEDIESGNLPENFLGAEIIFPEVFSIGSLEGEDISKTWGVESYRTYDYLDTISSKISVGVVDTGIDYNHPDLTENVSTGYDFVNDDNDAMDDQGHGTHVAGTIAASLNGLGIIGVNPEADLIPLKICNASGFCPSYAVLRALDYATTERIDILNMSLGGRGTVAGHPICAGISAYTDAGGIVVSASGNSNIDTSSFVPGGCEQTITVAAVDQQNNRASFSNYGSKVDVAAPGVAVYSTYPGNTYKNLSGTSMAAPHIAGLISIIQSQDPDITTSEVKSLLKNYPKGVQTTSGKSIASSVDIEALMNSFNETEVVEEDEEVVEQEVIEDISQLASNYVEETEFYDEIEIQHIVFDDTDEATIQSFEDDNSPGESIIPEVYVRNPIINLGGVEINSLSEEKNNNQEYTEDGAVKIDLPELEDEELEIPEGLVEIPEIIEEEIGIYQGALQQDSRIDGENIQINSLGDELVSYDETIEEATTENIEIVIDQDDGEEILEGSYKIEVEQERLDTITLEDAEQDEIQELPEIFVGEIITPEDSGTGSTASGAIIEEGTSIQSSYNCDIYVGQRCTARITYANRYLHESEEDLVSMAANSKYVYMTGIHPGSTVYTLTYAHYTHTINVQVKALPDFQELSCDVKAGQDCYLDLETAQYLTYENYSRYTDGNGSRVRIYGITRVGKHIIHAYFGTHKVATITVNVRPNVPEYNCDTFEGGTCTVRMMYDTRSYNYTQTESDISSVRMSGQNVNITGVNAGDNLIYIKYGTSRYIAAIYVNIKPLSEVSVPETSCEIWGLNKRCTIAFSSANSFNYTTSTSGVARVSADGNNIYIDSVDLGETEVYVKHNDTLIGTIHIKVGTTAKRYDCDVNVGSECSFYLGRRAYRYQYTVSEGGIVDNSLGGSRNRYLKPKGLKEGKAIIYVKYRGQYMAQMHVNVTEIKQYDCEIMEGDNCILEGLPQYYDYKVMHDGIRIHQRSDGRNLGDPKYLSRSWEGLRSGEVDLEIYGYGDLNIYKLAHLDVSIVEAPYVDTSYCETRVNGRCDIVLRNIGTDKYTIMVSDPSMIRMEGKTDYFPMYALKEGEVEIFVKNNETDQIVHTAIMRIEGEYTIPEPREDTVVSPTSLELQVGESKYIEIQEGNKNSNYIVLKSYPNIEVSYSGTDKYKVTAVDDSHLNNSIKLVDKDKDYHNATVSVSIVEYSGEDGGDNSDDTDNGASSENIEDMFEEIFQQIGLSYHNGVALANSDNKALIIKKINSIIQQVDKQDSQKLEALLFIVKRKKEEYTSDGKVESANWLGYMEGRIKLQQTNSGKAEGFDLAVEDYIQDIIDSLDPNEYYEILKGLLQILVDIENGETPEQFEELKESYKELYDIFIDLPDILSGLDEYEKSKYGSYVKTIVAMEIIPVKLGKIKKAKVGSTDAKTLLEIKELKDRKIGGFNGDKYVPNVRGKIEGTIDHVVKIEFTPNGTFGGVHSRKAILDYNTENGIGSAWFENLDESLDTWNKPYSAKVVAKDINGNPVIKTGGVPKGTSSMFPDGWSKDKIMDEVENAIKYNKGLSKPGSTGREANVFRGPSTVSGIEIDFVYVKDTDKLETFYPVIK